MTATSTSTPDLNQCEKPKWVGDTNCDDENNHPECDYDGGDCCTDTKHLYCKKCECKEKDKIKHKHCPKPFYVHDGNCDDENNIAECDYDGGDCCTDVEQKYCTECECKTDNVSDPMYY